MRRALLLVATALVLAACGGGGEKEGPSGGRTATAEATHATAVDDVTCGELESVRRRLEVAGELAGEYTGTLTSRSLLTSTFSGVLSTECEDEPAGSKPVPRIVEQADVARRAFLAGGAGSFTDALLDALYGDETATVTVEERSALEQANELCSDHLSLVNSELIFAADPVRTFTRLAAEHLARDVDELAAELSPIAAKGRDANLITELSDGLRELSELASRIAAAEAGSSEADALRRQLRQRADELKRSLPDATLFSCRYMVSINS